MTTVSTGFLTFSSVKQLDLSQCSKNEIRKYFLNSYNLNESIFTALKDEEAFYCYPDKLRLPLIFYFGHTAVVYVNKMILAGLIQKRVNLEFETLFETGVDEMSWDDTACYRMGGKFQWPSVKDVVDYRRKVKDLILDAIDKTTLKLPITMDSPWWSLLMGMEHERIHLETSSVLIRQLPVSMVVRPPQWKYAAALSDSVATENPFLVVEGGEVTLGKPRNFPSYGWDNEYGQVTLQVPKFEATKYLITNGQFLEFVSDNGYQRQEFWSAEGWKWKTFREAKHPTFWVCDQNCKSGCGEHLASISHCQPIENREANCKNSSAESKYRYRAMFDVFDLPMDWPVEVNYHEAKAFCYWMGPDCRLPTEAEMALIKGKQISPAEGVKCDLIHNDEQQEVNINLKFGSPTPVNFFKPSSEGFYDTQGNVWQWVEDHFNGLNGFSTNWLYDDFSSPCFDGKHNVILGGSWISTGNEASRFARFAFRRHFFQHLGFRVVKSVDCGHGIPARIVNTPVYVIGNPQQEKEDLTASAEITLPSCSTNSQYVFDEKANLSGILELEFGIRESLAAASVQMVLDISHQEALSTNSALVVGSSTGRTAFDLSKVFAQVLAIDYSIKLIEVAEKMKTNGHVTINRVDNTTKKYSLDDDCRPENVTFKQLTWLPNEIGSHDLVMVTFLERVQNPHAWLARLWETANRKGLVVIVSQNGVWTRENLLPILNPRLTPLMEKSCKYQSPEGTETANLSAWSIEPSDI